MTFFFLHSQHLRQVATAQYKWPNLSYANTEVLLAKAGGSVLATAGESPRLTVVQIKIA
jgi:hypothetical protein